MENVTGTSHPPTADVDALDLGTEEQQLIAPSSQMLEEHRIVGFLKNDRRARPFTLLRTQIAKRIQSGGLKMVGITSATPNAGKTFVALNLAASLSRVSEDEVFLVDLDLRRGSVATELGIAPETGISDYLSGTIPNLDTANWRVNGSRLNVLPTRSTEIDSAELLATPNFDQLMDGLRYNTGNAVVFCDLPPAFANDDAMITVQKLDAYILVVDSGTNNRKQLLNTVAMFSPKPCIGTVLNRYNGGFMDDYGYGYGRSAYDKYY